MNNSYRIKANVGYDQILNVNLKQDVDLYEILSLTIKQDNLYKLHSADYGVIVGRVLANDAFGVPNAKVSVFIPLSDKDELRNDIKAIYPYKSVTDNDSRNVKYNTLPNYKKFDCHQEVGSFPKKQLVLDDDSVLEVFDKYYKYTTITNKSGDYMIFGVPTGEQTIHVDIDLSDIGVLSQEPRDMIYKGYNANLFDSPTKFKKGTDLDSLAQLYNESTSVTVYPFWGDRNSNDVAITRKDISLQYKFEPTCVFIGSVVTDTITNSVNYNCIPDENVGDMSQLTPGSGKIEMIRKTIDDKVEEYQIRGNQLIDNDGTWCYQIPMNLDFIGMDEYGNIVPTDNSKKGIPTRARVRFRISLDENGVDSLNKHKAKYLIPNNPDLYGGYCAPHIEANKVSNDLFYEFGTLTPDDCFRDLYWNKVYSVKSYIPRLQASKYEKTSNYLAIKGVNKKGARDKNPFPFNKLNLNLTMEAYNELNILPDLTKKIKNYWNNLISKTIPFSNDTAKEKILEDTDGIGLDFYNDWINGCLYFPAWSWYIKYNGRNSKKNTSYDSSFCECKKSKDGSTHDLLLYNNASLAYANEDLTLYERQDEDDDDGFGLYYPFHEKMVKGDENKNYIYRNHYTSVNFGSKKISSGIIKKFINKDGANIFYYCFGDKLSNKIFFGNKEYDDNLPEDVRPSATTMYYKYARLFSTDIILLGSLKDADIHGIPKIINNLPSTTSNIPPMGVNKNDYTISESSSNNTYGDSEFNLVSTNGMNWGDSWTTNPWENSKTPVERMGVYKYYIGSGLFFAIKNGYSFYSYFSKEKDVGLSDDIKTPINTERICELGVTLDEDKTVKIGDSDKEVKVLADGLITDKEIIDSDARSIFATLNHHKLIGVEHDTFTGYKKYLTTYFYPTSFDGRLESIAPKYTIKNTNDYRNKDYLDFRFGSNSGFKFKDVRNIVAAVGDAISKALGSKKDYNISNGTVIFNKFIMPKTRHFYGYNNKTDKNDLYPEEKQYEIIKKEINNTDEILDFVFPLYDNSFYFYFGLNQGRTSIDKFYKQFYSECAVDYESKFLMDVSFYPASPCNQNNGTISVNTQEISMPYSITLKQGDNENTVTGLKVSYFQFINLKNGKYSITVTDKYGTSLTEDVYLSYQKISLKTTVLREIATEYTNQGVCVIYNNDYHAKLSIDSVILNGEEKEVSVLSGSNGVYILDGISTSDRGEVKVEIIPEIGEFSEYICSDKEIDETNKNVINICKPGKFTIKVCEICYGEEDCSDNIGYYNILISDTKRIEMYVNNVPLKYIVGENEEVLPYNDLFHGNGEAVSGVDDKSIHGWFGVHDPNSYSELFKYPIDENNNIKKAWERENLESNDKISILKKKFEYMFSLSEGAYVSSNSKNKFKVELNGGSGELLLRSAHPIYANFSADNTEGDETFSSFITGENNEVTCHNASPNIVSNNYRHVDMNTHEPGSFTGITGSFDFNPKYLDKVRTAGNHFAGFSNNANIIQTETAACEKHDEFGDYQTIPYGADCISELCLYSEKNEVKQEVTSEYRYFRTEFIDRRFDYDFLYITGHKCIHFGEMAGTWNMGRISAITYNGIEMAYDSSKNIISNGSATEYKYDISTATINLNEGEGHKKFYESKLYYGDGQYIELLNAYRSQLNNSPNITYTDGSCIAINHDDISSDEYKNFGLDNNGNVLGYPTKRMLNFYNIPYGDTYTFKNVSCGYEGIEILKSNSALTAKAVEGETVMHSVEAGEIINLICGGFESDCTTGKYNIFFKGDTNSGILTANEIKDLNFRINASGSDGFVCRFGRYGIRYFCDDSTKTKLSGFKSWGGLINDGIDEWLKPVEVYSGNEIITSEGVKNKVFSINANSNNGNGIDGNFINFIIDVDYSSTAADSLMKKIRVLNTSTIYNVSPFKISYESHEIVSEDFIIPSGSVTVSVDSTVTGGDNQEDIEIPGVGVNDSGYASRQRDYTVFKINSDFIKTCMDNICFNITTYKGDNTKLNTANYILTDNNVAVVGSDNSSIKIGIKWNQHETLLKDTENGYAIIKVYMKIKNEIKSQYGDGYMSFGFGFKIKDEGETGTPKIDSFLDSM